MATVGGQLLKLAPPPRHVPMTLAVSSYFGGHGAQFAWLVILIALVPIWLVQGNQKINPNDVLLFWGDTQKVDARVFNEIRTTIDVDEFEYVGWIMERETYVVEGVYYSYPVPDGTLMTGTAYGLTDADRNKCAIGATIEAEYVQDRPEISRAFGYRREASPLNSILGWSYWGALVAVGLALPAAMCGIRQGAKQKSLLARGIWAQARVAWREPFNWLPSSKVIRIGLQFRRGASKFEVETTAIDSNNDPLEERNPILFNEDNPNDFLLLKDFPGHVEVSVDGKLNEGEFNPYHYLWLPAFSVMGYLLLVVELLERST